MRSTSWPGAVIGLGLLGSAVALSAGWRLLPPAAVIVPIGLVPLSTVAVAFIGLARTGAVRSYVVVTLLSLAAPVADIWSRSATAGDLDSATWLGVITATTITVSGAFATIAQRTRQLRTPMSVP